MLEESGPRLTSSAPQIERITDVRAHVQIAKADALQQHLIHCECAVI